jgi:hypothetical protein
MAGRVPLENVSEERKKKKKGRTRFGRRLRIYEITRLLKNEPSGRKITLKINEWALLKTTACNKIKSTTYPYHVVLVPKQKHKKKATKVINYPGELTTLNSSRGHKISTRNGSVIGSDVTYRFLGYWIALRKVCSFRKTKQK